MSDRPSQHPTGRVPKLDIPRAPRAPRVDGQPVAPDGFVAAEHDEAAPSSTPTSPPPPAFTELRKMSGHPSPFPPLGREEVRQPDSRSFTLPGPHAVPKLLVDATDLSWFEMSDETRGLVAFIDGLRTILRIAAERGIAPREAQLRIADLRDRGVVDLD